MNYMNYNFDPETMYQPVVESFDRDGLRYHKDGSVIELGWNTYEWKGCGFRA